MRLPGTNYSQYLIDEIALYKANQPCHKKEVFYEFAFPCRNFRLVTGG